MISQKSIILILISIYSFSVWSLDVYASGVFSRLETQITPVSDSTKIKKMQLALNEFNLYSWEIDWNYSSVESSLVNYQKNTWIIKNNTDYWAWYFWIKTLTALKEDFPNIFNEISEKHLKAEQPSSSIRNFYVTAYYSPVLWQNRYTTWTYFGDVKLNWSWKSTASWKKVFAWLIAAPKNYEFWTKIKLEWLWVWIVEDRWWSIKNSSKSGFDYDRIDVWMWYWDEWLTKALKWWKRKVTWKIITDSVEYSQVTEHKDLKIDVANSIKEEIIEPKELQNEAKTNSWNIDLILSDFKNKTIENQENEVLTKDIKEKLHKINLKISASIEKKYWKDTLESIKYRNDIKVTLDNHAAKTKNDLRKKQLNYLKSLI